MRLRQFGAMNRRKWCSCDGNTHFHHPNCQCSRRRRALPPSPTPDIVAANRSGQVRA
jgi:hypothetical protein